MDLRSAANLIRPVVARGPFVWADLGAGDGVFTRALASLLGTEGTVYAIDQDPDAVAELERIGDGVIAMRGDIARLPELPTLDGAMLGNVLHYVPNDRQSATLRDIASRLRDGGTLIVAEYDGRGPNPWVPFPVSRERLAKLAREASLGEPSVIATRRSTYGGTLYVAALKSVIADHADHADRR
jgi:phospholipid N-methyltransferase